MIDLALYDYGLPPGRIALYPATPRSSSKLMVIDKQKGSIEHRRFGDIVEYLKSGDLLVLNDSKVFPARLIGSRKGSGGRVEIFLLRRSNDQEWEALVKPGKRLKPGAEVILAGGKLAAIVGERTDYGGRRITLKGEGDVMALIWEHGEVPLPPYINRPAEEADKSTYQTVYASRIGAAAAPTAGFHFTKELLDEIARRGIEIVHITLHPGLGTFRPITVQDAARHKMETEYYTIEVSTADSINRAKAEGRRVIAVGTTTVRALESSWSDEKKRIEPARNKATGIYIYPPYEFKTINCLLTNFHLPKSTLLLLVSALAGRELILKAYNEAIAGDYRFYSYGDAMLIL